MATKEISFESGKVAEAAAKMEQLNNKLNETLEASKKEIDKLMTFYTGDAANEINAAYTEFSSKYFETYKENIESYVTFLRDKVGEDYTNLEGGTQVKLAEQFK